MYSPKFDFIYGRSKQTKSTEICTGKLFIPRLTKIRQTYQDLSDMDTTDKTRLETICLYKTCRREYANTVIHLNRSGRESNFEVKKINQWTHGSWNNVLSLNLHVLVESVVKKNMNVLEKNWFLIFQCLQFLRRQQLCGLLSLSCHHVYSGKWRQCIWMCQGPSTCCEGATIPRDVTSQKSAILTTFCLTRQAIFL
jgi:hypothetical protein